MKKYKATIAFGGVISMFEGEERELEDNEAKALLDAGYITEVKAPTPRKGAKKDDNS